MNYETYIASEAWRQKRLQRLEIDGYRCRLCDHDGRLYRLEVHHLATPRRISPRLTSPCALTG